MRDQGKVLGLMGVGMLLLTGCMGSTPPEATVKVSGTVSVARAGEAVAGATVSVDGTKVSTTTDANGHYSVDVPVSRHTLVIHKDGYASTRVENFTTTAPQTLDEILQRSFDPDLPTTPPTVTLSRQTLDAKGKVTSEVPLKDGDTIDVTGDKPLDLNVGVKTTTASPDVNGVYGGIASLEVDAGSSGFLNAGRTRSLNLTPSGNDTFTFTASDFAAFKGTVDLHVSMYDFNGNRTHVIRHLKLNTVANAGALVAPTKVAPTAITFADTATYGALGKNPQTATLLKRWVQTHDSAALKALSSTARSTTGRLTPQAAPTGTVMWVDVNFEYTGTAAPRTFELDRSLDGGKTYTKVLSATPAKAMVDPKDASAGYVLRDNSSQLTPGVKTTYRVRAVSDAGTKDSDEKSVTPLGRYSVELLSPGQADTGVDTAPIFRWRTSGASDVENLLLLVEDRTQAEGNSDQWLSDVSGMNSATYDFDGSALTKYLQPFHAYDWQMAAVTNSKDNTAFSVGADFFNLFGVTANPIERGPVNEFVTGGY
ncbi:carboxypeptidase-like regulatory domain-containing protein [Deinococcus sonorensis]|uniref:Carboxypeptidase-like regulatory domain-containing protein n=2 Tax=Deinococcus sonorensis TaxID=309891 RepID=A0AAU7UCI6_9DEIO